MARRSADLQLRGAGGEPVDLWRTLSSHGVADLPPNAIDEETRALRDAVVLTEAARKMLRLDADLSPFYEAARDDPDLDWAREGAGRMPRSPTVFEDVVKTICT